MKPPIAITPELSAKGERHRNFLDLAYAECVERAAGLPLYFPSLPSPAFAAEAVAMIDGLVLNGGADIHPSYYGEEIALRSSSLRGIQWHPEKDPQSEPRRRLFQALVEMARRRIE